MNDQKIINDIKKTLCDLDSMPYGNETHHKILPPNIYHFEQLVKHLIDCLMQIDGDNIVEVIDKVISIRDNQLRELHVDNDKSFEKYGVNKKMEIITQLLHMHVDRLLV